MKFSELAKYQDGKGLIVSSRYKTWIAKNANPHYSAEALSFGHQQLLLQSNQRDRRGTISSSSLSSCQRRQQFTFLGMPELPPSPKLAAIFQTGTFMHIRWQMAGLTAGWLSEAEVPIGKNTYELSGTMDGVLDEDSVLELKSCNSNSFRRVLSFGPLEGHLFQVGTYVLTTGREKGVLIYEDKDTQEFKEFVFPRAELPLIEIEFGAKLLWQRITAEQLVEPLDECLAKSGKYLGCPFRDNCLKIRSWEEASDLADSSRAT